MSYLQKNINSFLSIALILVMLGTTYLLIDNWLLGMPVFFIAVIAYFIWLVIEFKIGVKEKSKGGNVDDRWSMELYALSRGVTVCSSMITAMPIYSNHLALVFFAVFVIGVSFRLYAIITLGRFYSHKVRITEEQSVITNGPYTLVRHPAYTGMLLSHLGFTLCAGSILGLVSLVFLLLPSIVYRIKVEEEVLFKLDRYAEYSKYKKKIIPYIY